MTQANKTIQNVSMCALNSKTVFKCWYPFQQFHNKEENSSEELRSKREEKKPKSKYEFLTFCVSWIDKCDKCDIIKPTDYVVSPPQGQQKEHK